MTVATLRLDLRFRHCLSSRDTRRQMREIMDRLRHHFNVSVAESGPGDEPGGASLVAVAVGRTRRDAKEILERVAEAVAAHPRADVLSLVIVEV